jgi:hypothetical protein
MIGLYAPDEENPEDLVDEPFYDDDDAHTPMPNIPRSGHQRSTSHLTGATDSQHADLPRSAP